MVKNEVDSHVWSQNNRLGQDLLSITYMPPKNELLRPQDTKYKNTGKKIIFD